MDGEVKEFPGWIRYKDGGATKYRSPSGLSISNARFFQLKKKYEGTGSIPEEELLKAQQPANPRFFGKNADPSQRLNSVQKEKKFRTPDDPTVDEDEPVTLNMPEPKLASARGRPSGSSATTKELEAAFKINLIIVTSIASLITGIPDVEMTQSEAQSIAIPAANLFEKTEWNKKIGRLIAGSGDYSLLGYALYLYVHRVSQAIAMRGGLFSGRSSKSTERKVQQSGNNGASGGGVAAGVQQQLGANLPISIRAAGAGRFAPITQPG